MNQHRAFGIALLGPVLGDLHPGEHRLLRAREVQALRTAVGLEA